MVDLEMYNVVAVTVVNNGDHLVLLVTSEDENECADCGSPTVMSMTLHTHENGCEIDVDDAVTTPAERIASRNCIRTATKSEPKDYRGMPVLVECRGWKAIMKDGGNR